MSNPKIIPGCRVGRLEVIGKSGQRRNGYTVWDCRCDCGGHRLLDTRALQRGTIRDCGCITKVPPGALDLTGRRFGRLVALTVTDRREYRSIVWRCQCDCGNDAFVSTHQLLNGYTKSCGCWSHPPLKEYIGRRFGSLVVTAYAGKRSGMHRWRCLCDCGEETVVGQTLFQTGKTKSCGCLQKQTIVDNLRLVDGTSVTILERRKEKLSVSNTSGCTGVYQNKRTGKWAAQITFKGKTHYLGSFQNFDDAVRARQRGEELHDDFLAAYYQTRTD